MCELKVITKKDKWRDELKSFKSDWYHSWDYHEIASKRNEGAPLLFLMTNNTNEKIAIPLLLRDIKGHKPYKDMTSVYGYPGFLFSSLYAKNLYDCFIDQIKIWSKKNHVVSIFSRINPLLIDVNGLKGCSLYSETVVINLTLDESTQKGSYRSVHRNLLKRLEKNQFTANWSNSKESIDDFKSIYYKTMKYLNADEYFFFDDYYFEKILKCNDFDIRVYNVYFQEKKICSGIFIFYDDIVHYHLSGTLIEYRKFSPSIMLIDQVRKDSTKLGFKYFHLGGGLKPGGDGLYMFKYGFSKKSIKFYFFKMVTNKTIYMGLSNLSLSDKVPESGFFPLYRKN